MFCMRNFKRLNKNEMQSVKGGRLVIKIDRDGDVSGMRNMCGLTVEPANEKISSDRNKKSHNGSSFKINSVVIISYINLLL